MNLLNQKLQEKLKQFADIDRDTIDAVDNKQNIYQKKLKINPSIKQDLESNKFDAIYSGFNPPSKPSTSSTTRPNITKQMAIYNPVNPKPKPFAHSRNKSKESLHSRNKSKDSSPGNSMCLSKSSKSTKRIKNVTPPNESGERLYNYGFYIKNKLEKKRQEEYKKINRQMTPKILKRSKNIYRDNHFEDRLYYKSSNSPYTTKKITTNINVNQFEYKPQLDKKSLLMANKLEPSSTRLLRKRKKYNSQSDLNIGAYYSPCSRNRSSSRENTENIKRLTELYNKGMEGKLRREKSYKEKKIKEENEYKNYTYKLKITHFLHR